MQTEAKIKGILSSAKNKSDENKIARTAFGLMDLTTLEGTDNVKKVNELCNRAISFSEDYAGMPNVAAVCVYPNFANTAKEKLKGTNINVACVAGAFPSGQSPLEIRLQEAKFAIDNGADEIDMVISRGRFLLDDFDFTFKEVSDFKKVCGEKHLKVILETGELKSEENIRKASKIAMDAGADFIKTSTGKIQPAATLEAMFYMLEEIREFYQRTEKKIGIKPAGGISTAEHAIDYYLLVENILGEDWLKPELFRIGASRLAGNILSFLKL
jgi:deoxyribose-phosphate aldolase